MHFLKTLFLLILVNLSIFSKSAVAGELDFLQQLNPQMASWGMPCFEGKGLVNVLSKEKYELVAVEEQEFQVNIIFYKSSSNSLLIIASDKRSDITCVVFAFLSGTKIDWKKLKENSF